MYIYELSKNVVLNNSEDLLFLEHSLQNIVALLISLLLKVLNTYRECYHMTRRHLLINLRGNQYDQINYIYIYRATAGPDFCQRSFRSSTNIQQLNMGYDLRKSTAVDFRNGYPPIRT